MTHQEPYAMFVLDLPGVAEIAAVTPAVILTNDCTTLAQLAILIRHRGGAAHFGPADGNEIDVLDILRGNLVMELLNAAIGAAQEAQITRSVQVSLN